MLGCVPARHISKGRGVAEGNESQFSGRPGPAMPGPDNRPIHDVEFVTLSLAYWLDEACRAADRCGCLCYSFGRVGACGITEEVIHVHSVSPV